ncbi:MAG: UvrD-helicase domain-containing protein [Oscillospiraceae bacterium]|nr:UvrD-helicase domain-containing protein [Oscillospiraceae bacterium]
MDKSEFEKRYAAARKKVIEKEFSSLNDMQRKAVLTTEGPLLLLAGAGSGKTTVLINRIVNLIRYGRGSDSSEVPSWATEDDLILLEAAAQSSSKPTEEERALCRVEPAEPWRILAITFTNKAADELKVRLERALGDVASDIWAMTFHSACVRILRRHIELLGYTKSFTIYDSSDSQSVMKRVLRDAGIDEKVLPVKSVLGIVSRAKDSLQSPETFADEAQKGYDARAKIAASAYVEYQKRLKSADAVDFDDLIYLTVKLLSDNKEVRDYYRRYFRYVLVDEYQDTSLLQYRLVSLLTGENGNICVVGDDDQSIYRFRGATIENILSFEENYKNARSIKLEQNYRSTGHILDAANSVIKNNRGRKGKHLWTDLGEGEKPRLYVAGNEDEEAAYIAARVLEAVAAGDNFRDFAVLYRMNAQSNRLEYAFKRQGIPYRVIGGMRFFDRAEIKDVTSYLCAVQNPADDLRLMRIINMPPRGIGAATLETLRIKAAETGKPVFSVILDSAHIPELSRSSKKLMEFAKLLLELRAESGSRPLDEFYDILLDKTGYLAYLGDGDENIAKVENIKELKSNIVSYMEHEEAPTLAGFLDEIALYTDLDSLEDKDNSVIMMTMHAAKGLEFPWVFVAGMEDGIFPSIRSIGEESEMEEERRLCYVALTRAKRHLILTAAKQRMLYGRTSSNTISRFVDEIPEKHIDKPEERPTYSGRYDSDDIFGYDERPRYGYYQERRASSPRPVSRPAAKPAAPKPITPAAKKPLMELKPGDRIVHRSFGAGEVKSVTPMPGDALVTVNFDSAGEKKMLLKTASAFITKE